MLNSDPVTVEVRPIKQAGASLAEQAARAVVETAEEAGKMTDLLGYVKAQLRKAEDARKALVKPLNDHVKWINQQFKDATEDLRQADEVGRFKIQGYERERARLAREEAERRRREEEERLLAEAEARAAEGADQEADEILETEIPEAPKAAPTRGDFGSSTVTRKVWKFRVKNLAQVPAAFIRLDEQAVRQAIRDGSREIEGLEIYEDIEVAIR
jgi:hypothetical protein